MKLRNSIIFLSILIGLPIGVVQAHKILFSTYDLDIHISLITAMLMIIPTSVGEAFLIQKLDLLDTKKPRTEN